MRVSYEWLKSMVDVPADPAELVQELIRTGTEVEAVERTGANFDPVVLRTLTRATILSAP